MGQRLSILLFAELHLILELHLNQREIIRNVRSMSVHELLDLVVYSPFLLTDAYYVEIGKAGTSNRGFAEWGEIFGDAVVATALLDRLLHHAVVIQIEGSSYRLREHAQLLPEHMRSRLTPAPASEPPAKRRRRRSKEPA